MQYFVLFTVVFPIPRTASDIKELLNKNLLEKSDFNPYDNPMCNNVHFSDKDIETEGINQSTQRCHKCCDRNIVLSLFYFLATLTHTHTHSITERVGIGRYTV